MTFKPIYTPVIIAYERNTQTFGYRIFQKRLELNLTLGETADAIGITTLRLSGLENEQFSPTKSEIQALAELLKLDYETLANAPLE
jgi:transcriptional regulator with XRE-family HTH domain